MAAYAAVVTLKAKFTTFLRYYDVIIPPELLKISELVLKELKSFLGFVERLDSRSRNRMSASLEQVVEAVHEFDEMEDEIEEGTHSLLEALKKVKEEYYNSLLEDEDGDGDGDGDGEEVVSSSSLKMVGLRDERSKLKEALLNQSLKKNVVQLAGMAGIGKTTVAREVFDDLDISEWFECRVWVRVGIEWKGEEITKAILAQVNPDGHEMVMGGDEEEIAQQLEESLKGKRYIIVLDDVWDTYEATKYLERLLSNSEKSSRVVLTSRMKDIDNKDIWDVFEMRLLNKEESWDLLREKVFSGGSCPPQLEKAGKKIAIKCDGLPLTIVTVADLLSTAGETSTSLWIDVAEKKKHQLFIDAYDQISKVLYPSYEKLRDDLKLCFLYMGVFPLKYEISRSKLINLWTAEEIYDKGIFDTIWHRSQYYDHDLESLKCLDECSLIMVYKKSSTYVSLPCFSIKAISKCGLHSSWWHFCQKEARRINFFYVLDCNQDGLEEGIRGQSRLSIQNNVLFALKDVYNSLEENCASSAQSLLCFGPYNQYMVPICYGLKLLQRLDALNIRFYDFPMEVLELVKLSYLALTCNGKLPPSISKLERLQYLIVHPHLSIKLGEAPSYMPVEIWDLEELKHLEVMGWDLPDLGNTSLGKLLTLSGVSTRSYTVLHRLPNLKKLKIKIELTPDAAADPFCCSNHGDMISLTSLKCIVVNPGCKFQVVPPVASFHVLPSSLKKLSLSGLGYSWEEMREISLLPHLKQLKLRCNAFQGQYWEVEDRGFPCLNFLLLEDIDLVKLVGASQSFGVLHHLSIKHCYKLEEIQLGHSQGISRFEVIDSNPLVGKSIKQIALRMGEEPEIFLIHHSWKSA